jgi:phosphoribosylaminoimidazole (AIR) synthetase
LTQTGAILDNIFEPQPFVTRVQALGDVPEKSAYRLWNMGNGMLLIVPSEEADEIVGMISDCAHRARIAGTVTSSGVIELHTKGCHPEVMRWDVNE